MHDSLDTAKAHVLEISKAHRIKPPVGPGEFRYRWPHECVAVTIPEFKNAEQILFDTTHLPMEFRNQFITDLKEAGFSAELGHFEFTRGDPH